MFVIARHSSFAYRGKAVTCNGSVGAWRTTSEGSQQAVSGPRQCRAVDAETGHHLWADRYDRSCEIRCSG
jgi:TolB-like protein